MDHKADKYGYLRKTGAIGVCTKAISVSGSTRGVGSLGSKSESKIGLAKTANLEGNESAMYERLEKRSLRGLKDGGTEKELRAGHNSRGRVKAAYSVETNPIAAARQAKKSNVAIAKTTGDKSAVKAAKAAGRAGVTEAKVTRAERNMMGLKKSDMAAGREARKMARTQTKSNATATKTAMGANQASARSDLAAARGNVQSARRGLREAMSAKRKTRKGLGALV